MPDGAASGPAVFRVLVPANDLGESKRFYESLLGIPGRDVAGGRIYFDCGPVILGALDVSRVPASERAHPTEAIYLAASDIEGVHARARQLGALDRGLLHDDVASPLGEIVVRPWGERSFYVTDPSGNSLCFVAAGTEFTGTAAQVRALATAMEPRAEPGSSGHRPAAARKGPRRPVHR